MRSELARAFRLTLVFTILCGVAYPVAVTVIGDRLFPSQAHGSLIVRRGEVVGSALIGQRFSSAAYFHPRPSAAGADGYDATASGGSNLGPTSRKLVDRVRGDVEKYRRENDYADSVPADAVTASASGLDPHISPDNARIQARRVAQARHADAAAIVKLVERYTEPPWLGIVGEPRVNVLQVNLELDRLFPTEGARNEKSAAGQDDESR